jgi:hypothetical protein
MPTNFKVGDHVRWNSEAGHVSGKIVQVPLRVGRSVREPPQDGANIKRSN